MQEVVENKQTNKRSAFIQGNLLDENAVCILSTITKQQQTLLQQLSIRVLDPTDPVTETIDACSRSLYALQILRSQDLMGDALHTVLKGYNTSQDAVLLACVVRFLFCRRSQVARVYCTMRKRLKILLSMHAIS